MVVDEQEEEDASAPKAKFVTVGELE